jgi:hypothetical protein
VEIEMRKTTGLITAGALAAFGCALAATSVGMFAATAIEYGLIAALIS